MRNCSSPDQSHVVRLERAVLGITDAIFIIVPNGLVLAHITYSVWFKNQDCLPRMFMAGLCAANLTFGVLTSVPQAVKHWIGYCAIGGVRVCLYLGYMGTFFLKSSHVIVVLMSFERVTALIFPFRHSKIWTIRSKCLAMGLIFIYANILAILPLLGINRYGYQEFCSFVWDDTSPQGSAYVYYFAIEGLLLTTILIVCNMLVAIKLYRMRHSPNSTNVITASRTEFICLMFALSAAFIICTTPLLVGIWISSEADFVAMKLFIINSAVDCHVYWILRVVMTKKPSSRNVVPTSLGRHTSTVYPSIPRAPQNGGAVNIATTSTSGMP